MPRKNKPLCYFKKLSEICIPAFGEEEITCVFSTDFISKKNIKVLKSLNFFYLRY